MSMSHAVLSSCIVVSAAMFTLILQFYAPEVDLASSDDAFSGHFGQALVRIASRL